MRIIIAITMLLCCSVAHAWNIGGWAPDAGFVRTGTLTITTQNTNDTLGIAVSADPKGTLEVDGTIYLPSANLTTGYALCKTTTGFIGHCTAGTYPACTTCVVP